MDSANHGASGIRDNRERGSIGEYLKEKIHSNSDLSFVSAYFTIYAYSALKDQLNEINHLRFLFGEPKFIQSLDPDKTEKKAFRIENDKLELNNKLQQKRVARECAAWLEEKVEVRSIVKPGFLHGKMYHIDNNGVQEAIIGSSNFTVHGLGLGTFINNIELNLEVDSTRDRKELKEWFDEVWSNPSLVEDVKDEVLDYLSMLYQNHSPEFIYFKTLFHVFQDYLTEAERGNLLDEKTGFYESAIWNMLYEFQKDGVKGAINKILKHRGCIIADSVGLGKTFEALAVIKYFEKLNHRVLVLCPKKLGDNWQTFLNNYEDNPLIKDRLNYDVLYHTDLLRIKGESNRIDLSRINWGNYDLVVIDESHNFRNNTPRKDKVTRYQKLLSDVMKAGVKTKLLMLSATPVNNKFTDLKNQLALAFEGETSIVDEKLEMGKSIDTILANSQKIFNNWSKLPEKERNSHRLLSQLNTNFDFFKLLDSVTIARSRKHIEKYYNMEEIGKFPNRLKPITHRANITNLPDFIEISDLYDELSKLNMSIYSPLEYVFDHKKSFYSDLYDTDIKENVSFKQSHREKNLQTLMRVNLLKRLESSVDSFRITLGKFITGIEETIQRIRKFEAGPQGEASEKSGGGAVRESRVMVSGENRMRIAVPVSGGRLNPHFGHSESFLLIDVENGQIKGKEPKTPPLHEPGVLPNWMAEQGVNVVIAGGMGRRALGLFEEKGIRVVTGAPEMDPEEAVNQYLSGTLVTGQNVCDH